MEKGLEHGSIAPRRKWTELIMTEGFGTSDGNVIQDMPKLTGYWLSDTGIG